MTLRQTLNHARVRLAEREELRDSALRDAELLLLHTLSAPRSILFTEPDRPLTVAEDAAYAMLVERRMNSEPMQYITGKQEFYGLEFQVTPAVLIPRPETELLVETALRLLPRDQSLSIADVGTGSGAIAVALARNLSFAEVVALDISPAALSVARGNTAAHGLLNRIKFLESDLLSALPSEALLDAVLSNPPYVAESDRETLHTEVRNYEPRLALFAGADGLDIYKKLLPQSLKALKPGGLLVLEMGQGQKEAVAHLLKKWDQVEFFDDLQGIPRVCVAHRPWFTG